MKIYLHNEKPHYFIVHKGRAFSLFGVEAQAVYIYPETDFNKEKVLLTYTELAPDEVEEVVKATAHNIPYLDNPPSTCKN